METSCLKIGGRQSPPSPLPNPPASKSASEMVAVEPAEDEEAAKAGPEVLCKDSGEASYTKSDGEASYAKSDGEASYAKSDGEASYTCTKSESDKEASYSKSFDRLLPRKSAAGSPGIVLPLSSSAISHLLFVHKTSPSKSPTQAPAPAPVVNIDCDIGFGSYTPTPGTCGTSNPDICCTETTNFGFNVECENNCSNCGAGPTQASCCTGCNGSTEYCCKTTNSNVYVCQSFGTSCGTAGSATETKYAVDLTTGQICLKTEASGSEESWTCS